MSRLDGLLHRLYVLARGERYARELAAEQRFHLELDALARSRDAESQYAAELAARRAFGNLTYYGEEVRRMTPLDWMDRMRQDIGYAWRGLRRSPGFTATVVLTLGLGLGVNAAMFSLLDRLFVRAPSGVAAPREVRRLYHDLARPKEPGGRLTFDSFKYPVVRAIAAAEDSTVTVAAFTEPDSSAIILGDAQITVRRSWVTGAYFRLLGARPQLGRFFADEETRIEAPTPVVVLSDALWRRVFNADVGILGKSISIGYRPFTIVGIGPKDFSGVDVDAVGVWLPANTYPASPGFRSEPWYESFNHSFRLMARVPTGANEERVLTLATQAIRSVHLYGYEYDSTSLVKAGPIVRALGPGKREQELSISSRLAGVAIIVLAIACANVANLLLVRATRRRREIAVRCALGVSRFRLCEQLLTESVLLAVLGGVAAVAFAYWAATALRRLLLPNVQWADGAVDLRALAFVGAAALVVGVIAGLAPAFQATRPDLSNSLKAGARESAYQRSTLRTLLLVAQAALSVVLLVGAGLFVRSLNNVRALDLGYDVEHSVFVRPLFGASSPPKAEIAATMPSVAERLASAPGVEAIAYSAGLPMAFQSFGQLALPDRDSLPRLGDQRMPWYNSVSPGFLRATGVKLLEGREFSAADRAGAPGVLVVSQSMARAYWPGESPIGKCLIIGKRGSPCSTVVGVAADVHGMSVVEAPHRQAPMQYYIPSAQANEYNAPQNIIVRIHSQNIGAFSRVAAQELKRAFPTMVRPRIVAMSQTLEREFRPWRLGAVLFTAFGALALIVAAIGVYSVVAYAVTQRMHEMGVRIALGAGLSDIVGLVTTETFEVVAVGVALGILASLALGRLVASLLYGLSPRDPMVMAAAAVVLCAIGVAASLVPAWRASRVDPVTALRAD